MAERATIARPYAKAAFEFAQGAGRLGEWSRGLRAAAEVVADARVGELLHSPRLAPSDLTALIADVAGSALDMEMQNFVAVLAENRRLALLPEIVAHYEAARAAVENTVDAEVVSAVPLEPAQQEKLSDALGVRLKRRVRVRNTVDAALLGGAVVRAGDLVIDGSLKGRLQRLATELAS